MQRQQRLNEIIKSIGRRNLLWLGPCSTYASPLLQIPQLSDIFAITAPFEPAGNIAEVCLEKMQQRRFDSLTYDLYRDNSQAADIFQQLLHQALGKPVVVFMDKPYNFFTTAYLPQAENVEYLGIVPEKQAAFNNKPWVERELLKCGIRTIPWQYYGKYNIKEFTRRLKKGPQVMRLDALAASASGIGISIIREPDEIDFSLLTRNNTLFAASRYLEPNVPLNINACVFRDGSVSLHGPSLQLIGIPSCTLLPLGYCGNDFAQIRNLDISILDELETMTIRAGKWLAGLGYIGWFGLDAIEHQGHVYFSEINPRFQGSSQMSAELDRELDRPDLYLNHAAAFFSLDPPPHVPLRELAKQQREVSQIICLNKNNKSVFRRDTSIDKLDGVTFKLLPSPEVEVEPNAKLFKAVFDGGVTVDGLSILGKCENHIISMTSLFSPNKQPKNGEQNGAHNHV